MSLDPDSDSPSDPDFSFISAAASVVPSSLRMPPFPGRDKTFCRDMLRGKLQMITQE